MTQFIFFVSGISSFNSQCFETTTEGCNFTTRQEQAQSIKFGDKIAVSASGFGLTLKWAQLTTHFTQQILNPQQRRFSRFKATFSFFFALAEFQNAGGFFNDRTTIFGTGIQDRINLALAHDDVLLATHAGIRQKILNVEQSARHTVDCVFAFSSAEQNSTDTDF